MANIQFGTLFKVYSNFTGVETLLKKFDKITKTMRDALDDALNDEGTKVMYLAKYYTPIETGELKASGRVQTWRRGTHHSLRLSFGGKAGIGNVGESNTIDVTYAAAVHELFFHHGAELRPPKPANQQRKFLERAMLESENSFRRGVADRLRRKLS